MYSLTSASVQYQYHRCVLYKLFIQFVDIVHVFSANMGPVT